MSKVAPRGDPLALISSEQRAGLIVLAGSLCDRWPEPLAGLTGEEIGSIMLLCGLIQYRHQPRPGVRDDPADTELTGLGQWCVRRRREMRWM